MWISLGGAFSSVQSLSRVQLFATPWIAARQASLSITNSRSSLRLMSIESVMPSSHLILCLPVFSCPQSLPASESFPVNQFFASCGQSIGASASASALPMHIQNWFPLGLTGLISLQSKRFSRVSPTPQFKSINSSALSLLYSPTLISIHGKTIALSRWTFVGKVMSLAFNMLSRLVKMFLPRSKHLLISWISHHLQWFWSPRK